MNEISPRVGCSCLTLGLILYLTKYCNLHIELGIEAKLAIFNVKVVELRVNNIKDGR